MKSIVLYLVVALFFSPDLFCQLKEKAVVLNTLSAQQKAWDKGDIEGYMKGYWQNDSLMFIGKNGITYGWQQTLDNYKKGYPDTAAMGKLHFDVVEIKKLSPIYYFVTGRWLLTRAIGNIGGSFTLLLRKIKGKWLIVKDHSS